MVEFFLKFGEFNRKIILPFLLALAHLILLISSDIIKEKYNSHYLESCTIGLGKIVFLIIPHIKFFSISNKKENNKCKCSKKIFRNYFILLILYALSNNAIYFRNININEEFQGERKSIFLMATEELSTSQGIEIVLITIVGLLLLKYKYFIHHYLSIILFFISSIAFDLILKNYNSFLDDLNRNSIVKTFQILTYIGKTIAESLYFCFIKYMIDKHYHNYWNINASIGVFVCVINIILLIASLLEKDGVLHLIIIKRSFERYLKYVSKEVIISKFIINTILQFFFSLYEILTIFYLSPEYVLIAQNLSKIYINIYNLVEPTNIKDKYQYCYFIFYFLQIFSLLIYLEIFELNFLNLNRNTKRNIRSRVDDDLIERIDSFNEQGFEAKGGYIFNNKEIEQKDNDNIEIELNQIKDIYNINEETNDDEQK